MKAVFIAYNQAYNEEIVQLLAECGQRGYTLWTDIGGRGSLEGEPHLGSHAWPVQNHAVFTGVEDDKLAAILEKVRAKDEAYPDLGLRAYAWTIEAAY